MPSSYHECEDRIQKAIDALNRRDFPSMLAAAEYFDVPYNRLRLRYQGKPSRIANGGRNRKLSDEQKSALINFVRQQYTSGYNRLRWDQVQRAANTLLAQIYPTGDPPSVSPFWARRFQKKHPELFKEKQHSLESERRNAYSPKELMLRIALKPIQNIPPKIQYYRMEMQGSQPPPSTLQAVMKQRPQ